MRFDFRNFPLPIHPLARSAALAGECLTKFRNFSAAQDFLFGAAPGATAKGLAPAAEALGLAPSTLESCSRNPTFVAQIDHDGELARSLGVDATPFFVVGRVDGAGLQVTAAVSGTGEFGDFEKLIEAASRNGR